MTQKPVEDLAQKIWSDYLTMKSMGVSESKSVGELHSAWFEALTQERAVAEEKYNKMLEEQHEVQSGLVKDIQHYKYVAEDVEALQQKNEALENALKETCNSPDLAYKLFDLRKEILSLTQKLKVVEEGLQKIIDWKFNWRGDCVKEAQKLARTLISKLREEEGK